MTVLFPTLDPEPENRVRFEHPIERINVVLKSAPSRSIMWRTYWRRMRPHIQMLRFDSAATKRTGSCPTDPGSAGCGFPRNGLAMELSTTGFRPAWPQACAGARQLRG